MVAEIAAVRVRRPRCCAGSSRIRLLALAGALTVVRWCLISALGSDLALLVLAQALHGASFGATHLAAMHYLRDQVPPELQASAQASTPRSAIALLFGLVTPVAGWLYASGRRRRLLRDGGARACRHRARRHLAPAAG